MTSAADAPAPRLSPLHARHQAAGAAFTDFAGWAMPVRYSSDLAEHHAVRTAAGLFDLSHMAEIRVSGADAPAFLDYALAGLLSGIREGQAKYSLLLNEAGGIIDDVVVYRLQADDYLVVANAGNRDAASAALTRRAERFDVAVSDISDQVALVAVQGPAALAVLQATPGITGAAPADLGYYRAALARFDAHPVLIARTGYTGEDGFELYIPADAAASLWDALLAAGQDHGLVPAGLASRDTLRLEAGMPLYGHELTATTFPAQAGLGRVVSLAKTGDFIGRVASEQGPAADAPVLVGLVAEGRRAGRAGYPVRDGEGETVGAVTSGALSPTLGHPVMMAYVAPALAEPGTRLSVDVRGTLIPAEVTRLPFYTRQK